MKLRDPQEKVCTAEATTGSSDMWEGVKQQEALLATLYNIILNGAVDAAKLGRNIMTNYIQIQQMQIITRDRRSLENAMQSLARKQRSKDW